MIIDHVINYETWGNNEEYFINNFYGYLVTCEINYFAEPTNCMIIDDKGKQVPNDIILDSLSMNECYMYDNENIIPCRMD